MRKILISILFIVGLIGVHIATAAPVSTILRNILPENTTTYDLGTTTAQWFHIYARYSSTTLATVGSITGTSTASSTFQGTISAPIFVATSTTATSTFSNGISLSTGCFRTAQGTCLSNGILSLNGLTGATQTFTDDTNVTIVSGGTAHVITWSGTLADSRVADDITLTNITQITNRAFTNILGGTAGSVIFSDGTNLQQNNANLFWDNTALRFGLGTTTPGSLLSVQGGNAQITGTTTTHALVATSTLLIPFGVNVTVTNVGSLGLDTTTGQLLIATSTAGQAGAATAVIRTSPVRLFAFRVASTSVPFGADFVTGRTLGMPAEVTPFKVTHIQCFVFGGTSIVINLTHDNGASDTNTITCTTTSTSTRLTINSNNTWTAGEGISMESGAVSGSPSELYVSVFGEWTRD